MSMYISLFTVAILVYFRSEFRELLKPQWNSTNNARSGVPRGVCGSSTPPPPEIPNALQNRAKRNPIVKTVKNC